MKSFKVSIYDQDEGSFDCGPVCSAMILGYFGKKFDKQELINKIPRCKGGTSIFENAIILMNHGLKVQAITANPLLFDGDFVRSNPSMEAIIECLKATKKSEKDIGKKEIIEGIIRFINQGGDFALKMPEDKDIVSALDHGSLVLASTYAKAFGQNEGGYHYVAIGGYDKDKFLIFNPLKKSRRRSWEYIKEVLFAVHTSTLYDYDNGAILVVSE